MSRAAAAVVRLAAVALVGLMPGSADAQLVTWTGTGANASWSTSQNWSSPPGVSGFGLVFSGTRQTTTVNDLVTSATSITFANTGAAGSTGQFTLSGNALTLSGNIVTTAATSGTLTDTIALGLVLDAARTITAAAAHNLVITGSITGNFNLTKSGLGLLVLSGTNTFNQFLVNDGSVSVNWIGSAGASSNTGTNAVIRLGNNANNVSLIYTGTGESTNKQFQLGNGTGASHFGTYTLAANGSGDLVFSSGTFNAQNTGVTATQARELLLTGTSPTTNEIQGVIRNNAGTASGTAVALTKTGVATWVLSGNNTYTGTTTVSSGTLVLNRSGGAILDTGAVSVSDGTLRLAFDETIGSLTLTGSGSVTGPGTLTAGSFAVSTASGTSVMSANLAGAASLTKTGAGTLVLSGSTSYAGSTTISGGVLSLGSGAALASGGFITFGGGTLQFTADNSTDLAARIKSSASAVALDTNGQSVTFATALDATNFGGLRKSGAGTLTLSASNAFTGGTTLTAGTLALGNAAALGSTSGGLTVNGGTLDLGGLSVAVGGLSGTGGSISTTAGASTLTTTAATSGTFAGSISGSIALVKQGAGTLTLSGSNTYSGTTTLAAGILSLGTTTALAGGGTIVFGGGTLQFTAANTADYAARFQGSTASAIAIDTNGQAVTLAAGIDATNTAGLAKSGAGTLTLAGTNFYTGPTTVTGGTLRLARPQAIYGGTAAQWTQANLVTGSGATLALSTGGADEFVSGDVPVIAAAGFAAGATLGLDTSNASAVGFALTDTVGNAAGGTVPLTLAKLGTGALVLTTSNGFTGGFVLGTGSATVTAVDSPSGSYVVIGDNAAFGSGRVFARGAQIQTGFTGLVVANPFTLETGALRFGGGNPLELTGTLTLAGGNRTIGTYATSAVLTLGAIDLAGNGLTFEGDTGVGAGDVRVTGPIGGAGSVTVSSNFAGRGLVLSGSSTFSGGLTITAGTVRLAANATGAAGSILSGPLGTGAVTLAGGTLTGDDSITSRTVLNPVVLTAASAIGDGTNNASITVAGSLTNSGGNRTLTNAIAGSGTLTLSGSVLLSNNTTARTLTVSGSGTTVIEGVIADSGSGGAAASSLTLNAPGGVLRLTGANTYTGTTTVTAGTLVISGTAALPAGRAVTVGAGILDVQATATVGAVTLNAAGTITGSASLSGTSFTISNGSGTATVSATLAGSGRLTKSGAGAVVLGGSNAFTGGVTIDAGVLQLGADAVGTAGAITSGPLGLGTLTLSGGTLTAADAITPRTVLNTTVIDTNSTIGDGVNNASILFAGDFTNSGGNRTLTNAIAGTGTLTLSGSVLLSNDTVGRTLTVSGSGTTVISGGIADSASAGAARGNLTLNAPGGVLWLTGSNAFSGTATVTAGSLRLGSPAALTTANSVIVAAAALEVAADNGVGSVTINNAGSVTGAGVLSGTAFAISNGSGTATVSAGLGGTGGLTKSGAGIAVLSGSNSYAGLTSLSAGTLRVSSGFALPAGGGLAIASGTLDLESSASAGAVAITGAATVGGGGILSGTSFTIANGSGTVAVSAGIGGTGGLTKSGAGLAFLSGSNAYAGPTVIVGGTLQFAAPTALYGGTATAWTAANLTTGSGATLALTTGSGAFTEADVATLLANIGGLGGAVNNDGLQSGAAVAFDVASAATTFAVADSLADSTGVGGGTIRFVKLGAGTLVLSGSSTFSGGVTLSAGQLTLNSPEAPGTGPLSLAAGTAIDNTSGTSLTLSGSAPRTLAGSLTFVGSNDLNLGSGTVTLPTSTITTSSNRLTFGTVIAGTAVVLTKAGGGTLAFTTGTTQLERIQIDDGTIDIGAADVSLHNATAGGNAIRGSGTIDATAGGRILLPSGATAPNGSDVGPSVAGSLLTINAVIADGTGGPGLLDAFQTGTLALTAANTFSGGIRAVGAVLRVGTIGSAGTPSPVGTGTTVGLGSAGNTGTLMYAGSGETTDRVLNLGGSTGGGVIDHAGSGLLRFTSNLAVTGSGAKTLTLQGATSGTGEFAGSLVNGAAATSLTKSGAGTWVLSGSNSYTGVTTVSGGRLIVSHTAALPVGRAVTVGAGILDVQAAASVGAVTLNNAGTIMGSAVLSGTSFTISNGSGTATVSATLAGSGGLTKSGAGAVVLSGSSVFTGGVTINAGVVQLGADAVGTVGAITSAPLGLGTLLLSGGTLTAADAITPRTVLNATEIDATSTIGDGINNASITFAGSFTNNGGDRTLTNALAGSGSLTLAGPVYLSGGTARRTFTLTGAGSTVVSGIVSDAASGTGAAGSGLTKAGAGTVFLAAANTYTGTTTVTGGALTYGDIAAFGTGRVSVTSAAILRSGVSGTVANAVAISSGVTATFDTQSFTATLSGTASGAGGVNKTGLGTLRLAAANTFSGPVVVTSGTLALVGSSTGGGTVTVNDGGTLDLRAGTGLYKTGAFFAASGTTAVTVNAGGTLLVDRFAYGNDNNFNQLRNNYYAIVLAGGTLQFSGTNSSPRAFQVGAGGATIETLPGAVYTKTSGSTSGENIIRFSADSTLTFAGAGTAIIADSLAPAGYGNSGFSIAKTGAGFLQLTGNNLYTGSTSISAGVLEVGPTGSINASAGVLVNGSTAWLAYNSAAALTQPLVIERGTLSGTGTIATAVSIGVNAVHAPGNSPGIQAAALESWAPGGTYQWELNSLSGTAGANWDQIAVQSLLDLSTLSESSRFTLDLVTLTGGNTPGPLDGSYVSGVGYQFTVATFGSLAVPTGYGATPGSDLTALFAIPLTNWQGPQPAVGDVSVRVNSTASGIDIAILAVPEPDAAPVAALGIAVAAGLLRRRGIGRRPRARSRAGFSLVELLVVVAIVAVLLSLLLPAVQSARESARRVQCGNNVRQLAVAVQNYIGQFDEFPTGRLTLDEQWSQHAQLLPYIEQVSLFAQIDFDRRATREVRRTVVPTFLCPSDADRMTDAANPSVQFGNARNSYKANVGNLPRDGLVTKPALDAAGNPVLDADGLPGRVVDQAKSFRENNGLFLTGVSIRVGHVLDGLSNTALFAEARIGDGDDDLVEEPTDWIGIDLDATPSRQRQRVYDACRAATPLAGPANQESFSGRNWVWGNYYPTRYNHVMPPNTRSCARLVSGTLRDVNNDGSATTASSRHAGGVSFALADGSTRFLADGIDHAVWWALGSRKAEPGEPMVGEW